MRYKATECADYCHTCGKNFYHHSFLQMRHDDWEGHLDIDTYPDNKNGQCEIVAG